MIKVIDAHRIMLEYRLSRENPFPAPHQDALSLLYFIFSNLYSLKINTTKIVICSFSSGVNMAAVLCNTLPYDLNFKPFHQYLLSGAYAYTDSLHHHDHYVKEDKMLEKNSQALICDLYCQDTNRKDPFCSPN